MRTKPQFSWKYAVINLIKRVNMETIYLETSFISYLVSQPSRDLLVAAHQQITHEWWITRRNKFECYISQVVIDEASTGNPSEAKKRMDAINDFAVLEFTDEAESLAMTILTSGKFPQHSIRDAAHTAIAVVNDIDYLLTWNCKHLANAQIIRKISVVCNSEGYNMPVICTPEELMGE
jgi:hypothetical protein